MKHYKIKTTMFLLLISIFTGHVRANPTIPVHTIFDNPWRSLEHMFIIAPEEDSNSIARNVARVGIRALGTIPGTIWMHKNDFVCNCDRAKFCIKKWKNGANQFLKDPCVLKFFKNLSISFLLSAVSSEILGQITNHIMLERMYVKHFENFVVMWPTMKDGDQIPKTFHKIFDYIHEQYTVSSGSKDYIKRMCLAIAPKMRQSIYERFPAKYNDRLNKKVDILPYIGRACAAFGFSLACAWADDRWDVYDTVKDKIEHWRKPKPKQSDDLGGKGYDKIEEDEEKVKLVEKEDGDEEKPGPPEDKKKKDVDIAAFFTKEDSDGYEFTSDREVPVSDRRKKIQKSRAKKRTDSEVCDKWLEDQGFDLKYKK